MNDHTDPDGLAAALALRTAQLHEVDHRVKNSLQLISSLVTLQARRETDEHARAVLRSVLDRVGAVATVHRRMFQNRDYQQVDAAEIIRDLSSDLVGAVKRQGLSVALDLDPTPIPATQAAPLTLILNELVGNALKHGFPDGRAGVVRISLSRGHNGLELVVADDGIGRPPDAPSGFGLTVVQLLCQQLRGGFDLRPTQPGVRAVVTVPFAE